MDYCSGVWGHVRNDKITKIHTKAIRCFLGVNKYAPVAVIEGDMGWITPETRHKLEILRTWNNLVAMDDKRLPKLVYNYLREQSTLCAKDTKEIFNQIKCLDLFDKNVPIINFKEFLNHVK